MVVGWLAGSATAVLVGLVLAVAGTVVGKRQHFWWYLVQAIGVPLVIVGTIVAGIATAVLLLR